MTRNIPKFAGKELAAELLVRNGDEFAVVENPSYVFPPYEMYPLPARSQCLTQGMVGAVMDMDGTTTTTEPLCIHSLEEMVRRITGRDGDASWEGLDEERDYPHIIGNSTTKHVEYLIRTYEDQIKLDALRFFYVYAAAWTLGKSADEGRKNEVVSTINTLGIGAILKDSAFETLQGADSLDGAESRAAVNKLAEKYGPAMDLNGVTKIVRAAIDIYYQRYHYILALIARGEAEHIAESVLGDASSHLIAPMPGIGVFLAMIKGWLGDSVVNCFDAMADYLVSLGEDRAALEAGRDKLAGLGRYFEKHPCAVAIVTSSIFYEANIVISEVFRILAGEIETWDIPADKKDLIADKFASYRNYYDGFITATDSSEIRLKPHRDLYSIALHQMGVMPEHFHQVVGFEDSESGTIAIRAAGIPLCCAVPFPETKGHVFDAASYISYGGIPEVILKKNVFLPEQLVAG